jgi:hypothetical protein
MKANAARLAIWVAMRTNRRDRHLAERAAGGGLAIVVVPPTLVSQWTDVVRDVGVSPAAVYSSPASFRLAFGKRLTPWPESGLVICGSSVVRRPLATKTLLGASPSLLVVDDVAVSQGSDLVSRGVSSLTVCF